MKIKSLISLLAVLTAGLSFLPASEPLSANRVYGDEKIVHKIEYLHIRNLQGETLGRVREVAVDLNNGRVAEVLVIYGGLFGVGARIVAVPPSALQADPAHEAYLIDSSRENFEQAPSVSLKHWNNAGQAERIAEAYRHFGSEPYFDTNVPVNPSEKKVALGNVQLGSKILNLRVKNPHGDEFGRVAFLNYDFPQGLLVSVVIASRGNTETLHILPAAILSYDGLGHQLTLEETKNGYAREPRYVFIPPANGNKTYSQEQAYTGPRSFVSLEQGSSVADLNTTSEITSGIQASRINIESPQVATMDGRITLRGTVDTEAEKKQLGVIAIASSRLELLANQIKVGKTSRAD